MPVVVSDQSHHFIQCLMVTGHHARAIQKAKCTAALSLYLSALNHMTVYKNRSLEQGIGNKDGSAAKKEKLVTLGVKLEEIVKKW